MPKLKRPPQQTPLVGEDVKTALKHALLKKIRETPGIPAQEAAKSLGIGRENLISLLNELSRSNDAEVRRAVQLHRAMGDASAGLPPDLAAFLRDRENGNLLAVLMFELKRNPKMSPIELQQKTLFSLDTIAKLLKELAILSKDRSREAGEIRAVLQLRRR